MTNMLESILNLLFGWRHYRFNFIYRVNGHSVTHISTTLGVRRAYMVADHRALKQHFGPIYHVPGIDKWRLNNGELAVEPLCYLGRWKKKKKPLKRKKP
jgi:hypothetical protein